jgi:hypothetical protein
MLRKVGVRIRAFASDSIGVAAIEFAVVGPVFITLVCLVLQTMVLHYYTNCLDGAVRNFVAEIRSGQFVLKSASGSSILASDIRTKLAVYLPTGMSADKMELELFLAPDCTTNGACWDSQYANVNKAIRKIPSFSSAARGTAMAGGQRFDVAAAGQSQYLAVYYPIPSINSFVTGAPTAVSGGKNVFGIVTTAMWVVDPSVQP